MSTPTPAKPTFRSPSQPPLKPPTDHIDKTPPLALETAPSKAAWQPIATAPENPEAVFRVRVTVLGKDGKTMEPVGGTETVVRYRQTRKRVGGKWVAGLTIIDDRLGTKLGFRPTEWAANA